MKILVTGGNGQLGMELQRIASAGTEHRFSFYDLPDLDIAESDVVERVFREQRPDVVINAAAYTAVDRAESDADLAFRVNRDGAANLASFSREAGALLVHVSTDYVFDGKGGLPYTEEDEASPLGVYGRSKHEGEELVRAIDPSHLIVRTSWLYSAYGANFVKTMLKLGAERDELRVVFDQIGTPTHAADLAAAIMQIVERLEPGSRYAQVLHYSNEGVASWYDFALAIMELSGTRCRVLPIRSADFQQATAPRPHCSVLDKSLIKRRWGIDIPHWRQSLQAMLTKLQQDQPCTSS